MFAMIAFISDLIFKSKAKEIFTDSDSVQFLKSIDDVINLPAHIRDETFVVDLNQKRTNPFELIQKIRSMFPETKIIAFGSHVNIEYLEKAKACGATSVLANSQFVKFLEQERQQRDKTQVGAGWLTTFVFAAIFCGGIWYLFNLIPVYYRYYELENAMHSIARISKDQKDTELRKRLISQMRDIGTPGDYTNLMMDRSGNEIRIQYRYEEEIAVTLFGKRKVLQSFTFSLDVTDEPQA